MTAITLAVVTAGGAALADAKEDAATAYDKGAAAYDRGDFALAASQLARADELAPNLVTLELALGAVLRADDAILGMTLAERAEKAEKRRGTKVDKLAEQVRRKYGSRAGKLNVSCRSDCEVKIDGKRFERGSSRGISTWLSIGSHDVAVEMGGQVQRSDVRIEAGKTVELVPTAPVIEKTEKSEKNEKTQASPVETTPPPRDVPAQPPPRTEVREPGVSSTWFWVALGATAIAGGASIVSGLDTSSKYDTFLRDRSNTEASNAGRAADQRTVILLAGTGVLAAATAVLGLFIVDWKGGSSTTATAPTTAPRFRATGFALPPPF